MESLWVHGMQYRWTLQVLVVVLMVIALVRGARLYRAEPQWRYCLRRILPLLAHIVVFNAAALVNEAISGTQVPLQVGFVWWANLIRIQAGLSFIDIFGYWLKNSRRGTDG